MKRQSTHLSDAELLLLLSRELSSRAAIAAHHHLNQCDLCSTRSAQLNVSLADLQELHGSDAEVQHSAFILQRSRLLKAMQATKPGVQNGIRGRRLYRRLAFPAIATCVLLLAGRTLSKVESSPGAPGRSWRTAALPSPVLTPGATQAVALSDLCRMQGSTARMTIDNGVARKVFQEYGVSFAARDSYEVDYLITPGLGGSNDLSNLWPEPQEATAWNSHVKDALEDHLHTLVCEGQLPLATAQSEISVDWIAAYKKHFHTDKPLRG